jgi:hypothetical protein
MIAKCRFCDFRRDEKTDIELFRKAVEASYNGITEDFMLFMGRMHEGQTTAWSGVKVHMGQKHKGETYYGIWPDMEFTAEEKLIIEEAEKAHGKR